MEIHPLLEKDAILDCLHHFVPTDICVDSMKSFFGMMDDLHQLHQFEFDNKTKIKMFLKAFSSDIKLFDEIKHDPLNAHEPNTHDELNNTTITDFNFDLDEMIDAALWVDHCQKCCFRTATTCIPALDDNIVTK